MNLIERVVRASIYEAMLALAAQLGHGGQSEAKAAIMASKAAGKATDAVMADLKRMVRRYPAPIARSPD